VHPGQPAAAQAAQERGPKGFVLRVADIDAEHFAGAVDRDAGGDHHRARHHPPVDAGLDVGRVAEHIRKGGVVQGPAPEGLDLLVEVFADA
jgi:hypothetical protein